MKRTRFTSILCILCALFALCACGTQPVLNVNSTKTAEQTSDASPAQTGEQTNSPDAATDTPTQSPSTTVPPSGRVGVMGVRFDVGAVTLEVGGQYAISAVILPENATNKKVHYRVDDPSVCSYGDGKLTALSVGRTVLTAEADEDGYIARCEVIVTESTHPTSATPTPTPVTPTPTPTVVTPTPSDTPTPTPTQTVDPSVPALVVTELLCSNNRYPVYGRFDGYVEIYNPNDEPLNLGDYYLSDDLSAPLLSRLPQKTLAGRSYACVPASDLTVILSLAGKTLYLTHVSGGAAGQFKYPAQTANVVYAPNGYTEPTPGYENSPAGRAQYLASTGPLVINEAISSNSKYGLRDGDTHDMIELKNNGSTTLDLSDYYLSDSRKKPQKYRLPSVSLAPGQVYTVYCDSEMTSGAYAPFDLSKDGEFVLITDAQGNVCDAFSLPYIPTDRSWGRASDGLMRYFETPSFGAPNGAGKASLSGKPQVSVAPGQYAGTQYVFFRGAQGKLYYTTDGSRPTTDSKLYAGETIEISKTATLRAFLIEDGKLTGEDVSFDYIIDARDFELPVVKLTAKSEDVGYIFENYNNKELEIEGCISMYENGELQFSLDCGIKLHGNYSRRYDKKSFHVKFRTKYGDSKLNYDLFGDGKITSFKDFVLRSGSQDRNIAMMRDEFSTSLVGEYTDILVQNYRPVNVFLNDEYVGVYYIREKINEQFIADHFGVSPKSVGILYCLMYEEYGDCSDWTPIKSFILNNDLTTKENYDYICEHVAIDELIDYYIALCWADNRDEGNTRMWYSSEGDGKWHFIMYDNDLGFGTYYQFKNPSSVDYLLGTYVYNPDTCENNALIYKLLRNETFKDRFLRRFNELCKTLMSDSIVNARIDKIASQIDHDLSYVKYINYNNWKNEFVPNLRAYVTGRAEVLKKEFSDLLGLTEAEKQKYFY